MSMASSSSFSSPSTTTTTTIKAPAENGGATAPAPPPATDTAAAASADEHDAPRGLPACTRVDVSDSNERSPWSRKTILAFDGGGIKGYSSLLIMKRLMYLIEQLERGLVSPFDSVQWAFDRHDCSEAYAWNTSRKVRSKEAVPRDLLQPSNDLHEDVERTFAYECTNFKPHHYFDYMAGTSTGGLSAIMLSRMELNIEQALSHYQTVGDQVFGKPRFFPKHIRGSNIMQSKYAAKQMEHALQEVTEQALQEELKQWKTNAQDVPFESDANRCRTIVVALGAKATNRVSWQPYLFRSYNHPHPSPLAHHDHNKCHRNPGQAHRHPIWSVARATSAAPTFFEPQRAGDFIFKDGGLGQNNPSHLAWDEVVQLHEQTPELLLSIGTGKAKEPSEDKSWLPRFLERLGDNLKLIDLLQKIATGTETTDDTVRDILEAGGKAGYYRLNVDHGVGDIDLDEWQPKVGGSDTRRKMLTYTKEYLGRQDVNAELLRCARRLVHTRRERAKTDRWEQFACRVAYYCPEMPACSKQGRTFDTRDELRRHAIEAHSFVRETRVRNHDHVRHACILDECCTTAGVHVFDRMSRYREHLAAEHGILDVKFSDQGALEAWLDGGRWSHGEAFKRRETELNLALRREAELAASSRAGTAAPASLELLHDPPPPPPSSSSKHSLQLDGGGHPGAYTEALSGAAAEDATTGAELLRDRSAGLWHRLSTGRQRRRRRRRRETSSPSRRGREDGAGAGGGILLHADTPGLRDEGEGEGEGGRPVTGSTTEGEERALVRGYGVRGRKTY